MKRFLFILLAVSMTIFPFSTAFANDSGGTETQYKQLLGWGVLDAGDAPDYSGPVTRRLLLQTLCGCVYGVTAYPDQSALRNSSSHGFTFADIADGTEDCSLAVNAALVYHMLAGRYDSDPAVRYADLDQTVTCDEALIFVTRLLDWYTGGAGELARLHRPGLPPQHWTVANHLGIINGDSYYKSVYSVMTADMAEQPLQFGQLVSMIHTLLLTELTVNDYGTERRAFLLGEVVSRR